MTDQNVTENGAVGPVGEIVPATAPDVNSPPVARQLSGGVAVLTMQSAPHNFLGVALLEGLLDGLGWAVESGARAVLLRSSLRNFCAGADVALFESADRGVAPDLDLVGALGAFDELPIPVVVAVHGVCVGGGFEIALACDLIVAAESAKIGSVEATIGMNPLMGGIQRVVQRAGAARAKEMALLGRRYDARTLERWNVFNRVVADDKLAAVSLTLAQELANGPTLAHASTKAIVSYTVENGVRAADRAMGELQKEMWASADLRAGLAALAETGPGTARFEGR